MSYYTDCVAIACVGLPTEKQGKWPFKTKSEYQLCMKHCETAGEYESKETQYEEGFHKKGDVDFNADIDIDANAKAELYQGFQDADDTYVSGGGSNQKGGSRRNDDDQGDDLGPLLFAGLAAMGLVVVLKL